MNLDQYVPLLRRQCAADDGTYDEDFLRHKLEAAHEYVVSATARTEDELAEAGGGVFPPSLVQAMLMLAAHWYNQLEAVSGQGQQEVPLGVETIVRRYRKLS